MLFTPRAFSPWRELNQLRREMDDRNWPTSAGLARPRGQFPHINAWQSKESLVLTAEIPGIEIDDLDLTVKSDSLTMSAKRPGKELGERETYLRQERWTDRFERQIALPFEVDPNQTDAAYEKGILTITLHRPAEHKPKKVTIKSA